MLRRETKLAEGFGLGLFFFCEEEESEMAGSVGKEEKSQSYGGLGWQLQGEINQGGLGSLLKTPTKDPGERRLFLIRSRRLVLLSGEKELGFRFFLFFLNVPKLTPPPSKNQFSMVFIGKLLLGFSN